MKVMLIYPPGVEKRTLGPPLGLGYLAACLEEAGHKVRVVESILQKYGIHDIKKEIKRFDPDVVGITAMTQHIYTALSIARITKEYNPNCMTVLGGAHPTVRANEILEQSPYVDVIVRGEGEKTFVELLEKKNEKDLRTIKGISFRSNGKIIKNKDREAIEDLDSLPFPAYHLMSMKKYKVKIFDTDLYEKQGGQAYGAILTSRGCPFGCYFCASYAVWGRRWRARSPENVVEELKLLRNKYGIKVIDFLDDTFSLDKKRTERICKLIKEEDLDIWWTCLTRVDLFNKDMAFTLKKAGCHMVFFGFESGVQQTLEFLNKGFKLEEAEKAVKIAKDAGLDIIGNFIIGIPGETKEMINRTIAFAKKLDLYSTNFTILVPFPGTKIYEIAEKNNLLLTKDWTTYIPSNSVMKVPGFTPRELKKILKKADLSLKFRHLLR